ncbi:L,D-transpeptidase [Bdellovibrio sp. HCB2-146]|uniref:L,D-transpeptidase n=1 Tax=Bdellovibrio sp. HCB2-146 TaxID=3394362 RepID=UPI0039BC4A06
MKSLRVVFFFAMALVMCSVSDALAETKAEFEARIMTEDSYEAPRGVLFDEEAYFRGETPLNEFVNVIVINKAARGPDAQTLRLYTNRQLRLTTKISSGREDVEHIGVFRGIINGIFKGTTESHWRHTTRGFYTIKRVHGYNYRSGESKFHMPYAMFFNEKRGLAVHQVPPDLSGGEAAGEAQLGKRASSGCVRVHKSRILDIHSAVTAADKGLVPVIDTRTGRHLVDRDGRPRYEKGFRSIVIVEEY